MEKKDHLSELMSVTMEHVRAMADANAIIGTAIETDGVTLIPVSRLSFGVAGGGTEFSTKKQQMGGDNAFGGGSEVPPQNLLGAAQLEYRTPDVVIRVNPDRQDLVQTRVLGGAKYLLIKVDEGMELNGVSVRVPEEQKD